MTHIPRAVMTERDLDALVLNLMENEGLEPIGEPHKVRHYVRSFGDRTRASEDGKVLVVQVQITDIERVMNTPEMMLDLCQMRVRTAILAYRESLEAANGT